ncbi:MAG: hypothetical protein GY749_33765 [Desulfobacteraceae bacterium]|nr:hypothetical protein [Desulfobacteraceae bacterium]
MKRLLGSVLILMLLSAATAPQAIAVPELSVGSATIQPGGTASLNISLYSDGTESYAGINAKIILPEKITVTNVSKGYLLSDAFKLDWQTSDTGDITFIAYSATETFTASSGILLTLEIQAQDTIQPGTFNVSLADYALSNKDAESVSPTVKSGSVTVPCLNHCLECNYEGGYQYTMTIYAKVIVDEKFVEADGSMLAAYKNNDECRGSASIIQGPDGKLFQLLVASNYANESGLTLKVYDAETDQLCEIQESFNFTANGSQGDIANPWIIDCNDCNSTQTIPLTSGWNWISFNTLPEDDSVDNVLSIYPAKNNDEIKTSDEVCTFYTDKWYCNGDSKIRPGAMYLLKVQTQNPDDLIIEGCPADAPDGVSILSGWNWIGFNLQNEMDMNTALGSLNSSDGDEIKTWDQVCTYYEGEWWCNGDSKMKPGYGYLLRTDKPGTLIYPEYIARSKTRRRTIQAAKSEYSGPDWSPMPGMQYIMVIHTRVQLNNNHFIESDGSILAAFKDDECRGAVKISSSPSGKYFQLLAASNETSESDLVLKVYDAETGQVYHIRDSFDFAADETIGFISDPVVSVAEEDPLADFISALWFSCEN